LSPSPSERGMITTPSLKERVGVRKKTDYKKNLCVKKTKRNSYH